MKGADWNKCTMPARNYASITAVTAPVSNGSQVPQPVALNGGGVHLDEEKGGAVFLMRGQRGKDGHSPLHRGEEGVGTLHPAADGVSSGSGMVGGLDVSIQVEIDNHSKGAETQGYGFSSKLAPFHFFVVSRLRVGDGGRDVEIHAD